MTIHDDFDELASAYLDGEATADEIARVESDPELMALVGEFRLIANAVAAPVTLPDEASRQRAIAAAIAATPGLSVGPGLVAPNVSSLDAARAKRAQRNSRLLSVAATLVAVAVGGAIIWGIARSSGGDEVATQATSEMSDSVTDAASDSVDDTAMADDAMDTAVEEEAMEEEAMEEEAAESAVAQADEPVRLGDDDDGASNDAANGDVDEAAREDEAASDAVAATEPATAEITGLSQFYTELAKRAPSELADADADDQETGLFALPIEERADYRGTFATTDDLLGEAAGFTQVDAEASPLPAPECAPLISRLVLAESLVAVGTAHLIDPVTGSAVALSLLHVTANGTEALVAIGLEDCRVFTGEDAIP